MSARRLSDRARRVADPERADDPGLGDAGGHVASELLELACHELARAMLLEAQFGVGVNVASPLGQLGLDGGDSRIDLHSRLAGWRILKAA